MDTIFALATPEGRSGVAIIRLSGPGALKAAAGICGTLPKPRQAVLRHLRTPAGEMLDQALVLTFPEGESFTGEPTVEFQTHGSRAVIQGLLRILGEVPGCRQAEAGEFTRRALLNDRMSLVEVEGLADLIDAETEAQRAQAFQVFEGHLAKQIEEWRERLLRSLALIEATIDFADEEVPVDVTPEVTDLLQAVADDLTREISSFGVSERLRTGFEVAIIGRPNVGKSTLLNALAGREAAITSEVAGTTRDVVEVRMDLNGLPVILLDTAGLRETSDKVEAIGVSRAVSRAQAADLRVFLAEDDEATPDDLWRDGDIKRLVKADLIGSGDGRISAKTGEGLEQLVADIAKRIGHLNQKAGLASRERQQNAILNAHTSLVPVLATVRGGGALDEIAAEHLRDTVRALDHLIGRIDVEHVLGEIFSSFCIGK